MAAIPVETARVSASSAPQARQAITMIVIAPLIVGARRDGAAASLR